MRKLVSRFTFSRLAEYLIERPFLGGAYEFCGRQHIQMERKRRAREVQSAGDLPCREAFRGVAHKEAENV